MSSDSQVDQELEHLVFKFLQEKNFTNTIHEFEKETRVYFDINYFKGLILDSQYDKADEYLSAFLPISEHKSHTKVLLSYFELRKCHYLELLDSGERNKALDVLINKLRIFEEIQPKVFQEFTRLTTLNDIRENERLKDYTQESQRQYAAEAIEKLITQELLPEAVKEPKIDISMLRRNLLQISEKKGIISPAEQEEEEEEEEEANLFDLGAGVSLFSKNSSQSRKRKRDDTKASEMPEKRQKTTAPENKTPTKPAQEPKKPQENQNSTPSAPKPQPKPVELHTTLSLNHQVNIVTFDFRGKYLIAGGVGGEIYCWDTTKGKCLAALKNRDSSIRAIKISPLEKIFAVAYEDVIETYSFDQDVVHVLKSFKGHKKAINDIAFNPIERNVLVSISDDTNITLWNLKTGREIETMSNVCSSPALSCAWIGDSLLVLTGDKYIVRLVFNRMVLGHTTAVRQRLAKSVTTEGKNLYILSNDGILKGDAQLKDQSNLSQSASPLPSHISASPNYVAGVSDQQLRLWDKTNEVCSSTQFALPIRFLACDPIEDNFAVAMTNKISILSTKSKRFQEITANQVTQLTKDMDVDKVSNGQPKAQSSAASTAPSKSPITISLVKSLCHESKVIRILHTYLGRGLLALDEKAVLKFVKYEPGRVSHNQKPTELKLSSKAKPSYLKNIRDAQTKPFFIVTKNEHDYIFIGAGGSVSLFQPQSGIVNERGHMDLSDPSEKNGAISYIEVNPNDNNLLGVGFTSGALAIYRFGKNTSIMHSFQAKDSFHGAITEVVFTNSGKYLAASCSNGKVSCWHSEDPSAPVQKFNSEDIGSTPNSKVDISFRDNNDKSELLVTAANQITIFSVKDKRVRLSQKISKISAGCYSGNGKYIFLCLEDGQIMLLNSEDLSNCGQADLRNAERPNIHGTCIHSDPKLGAKQCALGCNTGEVLVVSFD